MVISHSYVSLPEGNYYNYGSLPRERPFRASTLAAATPRHVHGQPEGGERCAEMSESSWDSTSENGKLSNKNDWLVVTGTWENYGKTMGKPWENGDLYSNNGWLVVTGTMEF